MKIIKRKSDNVVSYAFDNDVNIVLNEKSLNVVGSYKVLDVNSTTHEIVSAEVPVTFVPNCLAYDGTWSYSNASSKIKEALLLELKKISTAKENHHVIVNGLPIPTDEKSQQRIGNARANVARRGGTVKFPVIGEMDLTMLTAMEDAVFDYVTDVNDNYTDLFDAIVASTDLNLIDLNSGWPS